MRTGPPTFARPRAPGLTGGLATAVLLLVGCGGEAGPEPTFSGGVAQLVHSRCSGCHRPDGAAPFSLVTYEELREHGRRVVSMTGSGEMPPWPPSRPAGAFLDERRLEGYEARLLRDWFEGGMPIGDAEAVPSPPAWADGWQLGTPDLVVEADAPYLLPADTAEVFRNLVIPVAIDRPRWISAVELRPGSARVVHHATLVVDPTGASRALDALDAAPGFDGMGSAGGAEHPGGVFIGWTPGKRPGVGPEAVSWRLLPGSDLVVRLHLRPVDQPVEVRPQVGLHFADEPPSRLPVTVQLGSQALDIPAGEPAFAVTDSFALPVEVDVLSVYPHAHYLGDTVQAWADTPAGERVWLLEIPEWDFDWQDEYRFAAPLHLPAGSVIHMRYTYDNSAGNQRNPDGPPARVTYGPRSMDEMADLIVQTLPRSAEASVRLQRAVDVKLAEIKLDGYRMALADGSEDAPTRYNMGIAEASRGRAAEAEDQFRAAIALDPGLAEAFINLGIVLHQQGRLGEALEAYERAVALAPTEARAHHNLGVALDELGRSQEAEGHFRDAIGHDPTFALSHKRLAQLLQARRDVPGAIASFRQSVTHGPGDVEARMGLGVLLAQTGDGVAALEAFRAAAELTPEAPQPLVAMAELLATYPDASVRDPGAAIRLAEQAVALTRGSDPLALSTLATAHAAAGDLRQAVTTGERALAVARQAGATGLVQLLEGRLQRYRRGGLT